MRLTVAWLCACLAIYYSAGSANNGKGNVVLSLPPSLIAATEAVALRQLQRQQQQLREHEQPRWKKDARVLFDSGIDELRDTARSQESVSATGNHIAPYDDENDNNDNNDNNGNNGSNGNKRAEVEQLVQFQPTDFNRKALNEAYDLQARPQSAPQEIAPHHGHGLDLKYGSPALHKYWDMRCLVPNNDCPGEYIRALAADRTRESVARLRQQLESNVGQLDATEDTSWDEGNSNEDLSFADGNNDVFMLLTGEQDLAKFLHWALELLYPHPLAEETGGSAADAYHPGMYIWKKYNLSGYLEPPLIVDEPKYVLVRREKQARQLGDNLKPTDDPFIPPRGRKHTAPDLKELLNRLEPFVPNRGKRDRVKDMFKYDDLFFPNRGKKQRNIFKVDEPFHPHRGKKVTLRDLYNVDDPFFPNRGKRQAATKQIVMPSSQAKILESKVRSGSGISKNNNNNNNVKGNNKAKGDNWPQRMSTHEINGNDQSVKTSMSAADAALVQQPLLFANRLQSTRSMSAYSQQQSSGQRQPFRLIVKPGMRPQQQVKTSWPARSSLRLRRSPLNAQ